MKKFTLISLLISLTFLTGLYFWVNRDTAKKNEVWGMVLLGPTCPVERIPPDPNCAPKPYETSINIRRAGSERVLERIQSGSNGFFSVQLKAGDYEFEPVSDSLPRSCSKAEVHVSDEGVNEITLSCDTGIR